MENNEIRRWIHDLRSPLTGIMGFAQLIQGSDDIDAVRRWAANIETAALTIEQVVDTIIQESDG